MDRVLSWILVNYCCPHGFIETYSPQISSEILLLAVDSDTVTHNWTRYWEWDTVERSFPKGIHVTHHTTTTWESFWIRDKDFKKPLWWMSPMKHCLLYTSGRPYIWIHCGSGSRKKKWFSLKLEKFQNGKGSWTLNPTLTPQAITSLDTKKGTGSFL